MTRLFLFCAALALACCSHAFAVRANDAPEVRWTFDPAEAIPGVAWDEQSLRILVSPDRSRLAMTLREAGDDWGPQGRLPLLKSTLVLDTATGKVVRRFDWPAEAIIEVPAILPDGNRLLCLLRDELRDQADLQIIDIDTGEVTLTIDDFGPWISLFGSSNGITPQGWIIRRRSASDGRNKFTAFDLLDDRTGDKIGTLAAGEWDNIIRWSADGSHAITLDKGSRSRRLTLWETPSGVVKQTWNVNPADALSDAIVLPDGKRVMGVSRSGTQFVWDIETGERISRVEPAKLLDDPKFDATGEWFVAYGFRTKVDDLDRVEVRRYISRPNEWEPVLYLGDGATLERSRRGVTFRVANPPPGDRWVPYQRPAPYKRPEFVSEPLPVGEPTDEDLHDPRWWLARAEAEYEALPDHWRARGSVAYMAGGLAALGEVDRCRHWLEVSRQSESKRMIHIAEATAAMQLAQTLAAQGKIDEAWRAAETLGVPASPDPFVPYRGAKEIDPVAKIAEYLARGVADGLQQSGRLDAMVAEWRRGRPLPSGHVESLAAGLVDAGDMEAAFEVIETLDERPSQNVSEALARRYARTGDAEQALVWIAKERSGGESWYAAAYEATLADQDAVTERMLGRLTGRHDGGTRGRVHQGVVQALIEQGKLDEAIAYRGGVDRRERWIADRVLLIALLEKGRIEDAAGIAIDGSSRLDELYPDFLKQDSVDVVIGLHRSYHDLVAKRFPQRAQRYPNQAEHAPRGVIPALVRLGREDEAMRWFDRMEEQQRSRADTLAIAYALLEKGDQEGYARLRQPYAEAYGRAEGAPSKLQAGPELIAFDLTTGRVDEAVALFNELPFPSREQGAMLFAGGMKRHLQHMPEEDAVELMLRFGKGVTPDLQSVGVAFPGEAFQQRDDPESIRAWLDAISSRPVAKDRFQSYNSAARTLIGRDMNAAF